MSPDRNLTKTYKNYASEASKETQGGYLEALGVLGTRSNPE